jgi:site-specific DNA-methyltransferase (adenine-specific)
MLTITNEDNMQLMARYPDKYFDLAICDPPYGIGAGNMTLGKGKRKKFTQGKDWDNGIPTDEYFEELQRVSVNQIIWGGNYFDLPPTKAFLIWDKINDDRDFAECEYAWTSFNSVARVHRQRPQNMDGGKIHPTQKPIKLYKWLLDKYAKQGDKILDTHLGSGSIAIACHDYGFDLTACELDKEYFDAAMKRINNHMAQTKLF